MKVGKWNNKVSVHSAQYIEGNAQQIDFIVISPLLPVEVYCAKSWCVGLRNN